ncbi:MAG: hypothetical protein ACUVQK_15860, partial [Thermogutta sp.]
RMAALARQAVHSRDAARRQELLGELWSVIEAYGVRHAVMGASAPSWLLELEEHLNRASHFGNEIEGGWISLLEENGAGPRHVLSAEEILAALDAWEIGKRRPRRP